MVCASTSSVFCGHPGSQLPSTLPHPFLRISAPAPTFCIHVHSPSTRHHFARGSRSPADPNSHLTASIAPSDLHEQRAPGFQTPQPKPLPSKYPSFTFARCQYCPVVRMFAAKQGQTVTHFPILMNIWGKRCLPQPQLFTHPRCAVK